MNGRAGIRVVFVVPVWCTDAYSTFVPKIASLSRTSSMCPAPSETTLLSSAPKSIRGLVPGLCGGTGDRGCLRGFHGFPHGS